MKSYLTVWCMIPPPPVLQPAPPGANDLTMQGCSYFLQANEKGSYRCGLLVDCVRVLAYCITDMAKMGESKSQKRRSPWSSSIFLLVLCTRSTHPTQLHRTHSLSYIFLAHTVHTKNSTNPSPVRVGRIKKEVKATVQPFG